MIAFLPALAPITMIILIVWVIVGVTRDMKRGVKYFNSPIFNPPETSSLPIPHGKLTAWKRVACGFGGILLMSFPFVVDFFFPNFLQSYLSTSGGGRPIGAIVAIG